ncbi:MAG: SDR family NAD(P)-dependent oxidoreductase [Acidimicrobiales bacterium]
MELENAVAVVTGGASGLGEATARELAAAGASVAILDMNRERGPEVAKEIDGLFVACDVGSGDSAVVAIERVVTELGVPRGSLVCCAGIGAGKRMVGRRQPHDLELFERVVREPDRHVQPVPALRLGVARRRAPGRRRRAGVIVTTSSIAAFDGVDGGVAYSASKGGVAGMTLPMARDLAPEGVG